MPSNETETPKIGSTSGRNLARLQWKGILHDFITSRSTGVVELCKFAVS